MKSVDRSVAVYTVMHWLTSKSGRPARCTQCLLSVGSCQKQAVRSETIYVRSLHPAVKRVVIPGVGTNIRPQIVRHYEQHILQLLTVARGQQCAE